MICNSIFKPTTLKEIVTEGKYFGATLTENISSDHLFVGHYLTRAQLMNAYLSHLTSQAWNTCVLDKEPNLIEVISSPADFKKVTQCTYSQLI